MPPQAISALRPPPPALVGCVRALYWHDLRPLGTGLTPAQGGTHVPPGPYNGLVWLVSGRAQLVACGGQRVRRELPCVFVAGAHRHPYRSLAGQAYCAFGLVFQPAMLSLLTGMPMGDRRDSITDARMVLPTQWQGWLADVAVATDHAERITLCERFLEPLWSRLLADQPAWLGLTTQRWDARARERLTESLGWTPRHFQRRCQAWVGLPPGEVGRLLRLEQALLDLRDGRAGAAESAAQHGFSDQPHFTRHTKATYGRGPGALVRHLKGSDADADWLLRL